MTTLSRCFVTGTIGLLYCSHVLKLYCSPFGASCFAYLFGGYTLSFDAISALLMDHIGLLFSRCPFDTTGGRVQGRGYINFPFPPSKLFFVIGRLDVRS